jgi:glyoxylase-like metal-dependent hydrolase (beta-lactamase superfamily II)
VAAYEHAAHEAIIDSRFRVIETPGHTSGHVSYFYLPGRVLFTGDALALCRGRLWFMSRFLTEDRERARESMLACTRTEADAICPGHRGPLNAGVREHQQMLRAYLEAGRPWPLLS